MLLVDTHCHLDYPQFEADRPEVIARAREAQVGYIVVPGTDLESSQRAVALAEHYPEVWAAVGVHPNSPAGLTGEVLAQLRDLARERKVVAIGEIGIDLYRQAVPQAEQRRAFEAQLALAAECGKPVIVHDRQAHREVMAALRAHLPPAGGVLHAFSGDAAMAAEAADWGLYLGVDGPLTYKKNDALRAIFQTVALERVLIETDAPYLAPQRHRGRRNEPAYVRLVAEQLADIRGQTLEAVARATTANAARLFRWEWLH